MFSLNSSFYIGSPLNDKVDFSWVRSILGLVKVGAECSSMTGYEGNFKI